MRLYEHEGKTLFRKAGIRVPDGQVIDIDTVPSLIEDSTWPKIIKAQVLKGGRGKEGAISVAENKRELSSKIKSLLSTTIFSEEVNCVLVEEKLSIEKEFFLSVTYKNDLPAIIFSRHGGVDVEELSRKKPSTVVIESIDIQTGLESKHAHKILALAGIKSGVEELTDIMLKLYKCFFTNDALIAEINPLVLTTGGQYVAVDSKIELDDEALFRQKTLTLPDRRDFARKTTQLEMLALKNDQMDTRGAAGRMFYEIPGGNIIVLASGGGTSSEALDSLYMHGGHPAIFTEYSGNPTAEKVKGLTKIALKYPGNICGIWIVGGRANFTDIYETLVNGILNGIREIEGFDRRIPIVIRRAGLRDMEAFSSLRLIRKNEKYNIFLRGMETSISDSAQLLIHHINNYKKMMRKAPNGNAHE
ncbi:MAG: hypothetical protein HOC71_06975 [Candidatus Latescibacteria bacterium]|jgi:citryl-CoA synthetase large subunit|nr:hypothetical protein [Candidatus Latescibacterota bacterium]